MDSRPRVNEKCVIGLPSCGFSFNSSRSCFIAYPFARCGMEVEVLRRLLEDRRIEAVEAGGSLTPGQNAFCRKICSKIIVSRFCIVLLSADRVKSRLTPNANVYAEYGQILGFNKYVIPFQAEGEKLPFNVSGLDTVSYTNANFADRARAAIDTAIEATEPVGVVSAVPDEMLNGLLLARGFMMSEVDDGEARAFFRLGNFVGFNLVNSFDSLRYTYLGLFAAHRADAVIFRHRMLSRILSEVIGAMPTKQLILNLDRPTRRAIEHVMRNLRCLLVVQSEADAVEVRRAIEGSAKCIPTDVLSLAGVRAEVDGLLRGAQSAQVSAATVEVAQATLSRRASRRLTGKSK